MSTIERAQKRKREAQEAAEAQKGESEERRAAESEEELSGSQAAAPHQEPPQEPPQSRVAPSSPTAGALRPAGFEPSGSPLRVDIDNLRRHSMYPPAHSEERLSNEYRRIKRPLLANASGSGAFKVEHGNRIMITSSMQGEGKTFTALNLALSIAKDPDYSITLIDADVAQRDTSRVLGVAGSHGLIDLLADASLDPAAFTRPTSIESLSVLPAGSRHSLSEELLSSGRMSSILDRMSAPNPRHIVLFDAPPVLAAPDAVTLSQHVGQIVVVVKSGSTPRHQVTAAVDQLDPDKAVNMLLNQSLGGPMGDDYGGYYGYGSH